MDDNQLKKLAFLDRQFPFWGIYYRVLPFSLPLIEAQSVSEIRQELMNNYEELAASAELTKIAQLSFRFIKEDQIPNRVKHLAPKFNEEPKKDVLNFFPEIAPSDLIKNLPKSSLSHQLLLIKRHYSKLSAAQKLELSAYLETQESLMSFLETGKLWAKEYYEQFIKTFTY